MRSRSRSRSRGEVDAISLFERASDEDDDKEHDHDHDDENNRRRGEIDAAVHEANGLPARVRRAHGVLPSVERARVGAVHEALEPADHALQAVLARVQRLLVRVGVRLDVPDVRSQHGTHGEDRDGLVEPEIVDLAAHGARCDELAIRQLQGQVRNTRKTLEVKRNLSVICFKIEDQTAGCLSRQVNKQVVSERPVLEHHRESLPFGQGTRLEHRREAEPTAGNARRGHFHSLVVDDLDREPVRLHLGHQLRKTGRVHDLSGLLLHHKSLVQTGQRLRAQR